MGWFWPSGSSRDFSEIRFQGSVVLAESHVAPLDDGSATIGKRTKAPDRRFRGARKFGWYSFVARDEDSPVMNRSGSLSGGRWAAYGPLVLRLLVGFHLVHGTQDNVLSWTRMLEFRDFLEGAGFPFPIVCAVVSVGAQFICGLLYIVGFWVRWAAMVMLFNFTVALLAIHLGGPYEAAFPALVMFFGSLAILLMGPGTWSLDARRENR